MSIHNEEIQIDRENTFSFCSYAMFGNSVSNRLLEEIQNEIRYLAACGKDTLLVKSYSGLGKVFINCFLDLKKDFPDLRMIKVIYNGDKGNLELSNLCDGVIDIKNKDIKIDSTCVKNSIDDFIMQSSSTIICYVSPSFFERSRLKKHWMGRDDLNIINFYYADHEHILESDLYRFTDFDNLTSEEMAELISNWNPQIPSPLIKHARELKNMLSILSAKYANSPKQLNNLSTKFFASMFYASYLMGYRDSGKKV